MTTEITRHLIDWRNGDKTAAEKLLPIVYQELKFLARRYLRREQQDVSLQTTELINEAYLKLVDQRETDWQSRLHFFSVAARAMRNFLVDHARRKLYAKRGAGAKKISLDSVQISFPKTDVDILKLNEALESLAEVDERKSRIVELRFFGGLNSQETAEILGVSEITIKREWLKAKAFLYAELSSNE
ncbi:MAG: hypothetical protein QOH25_291 [Acidobacteriota bacterium]|jgi:RNA polymerase sigma factor (TIGR02999 family)|nr:hypothetical protein [Acidobacteriota bacterium]